MTNQFTVLNTALRSLQSHQRALDVTGHNIANAETEGYSRQRAEMTTTRPYTRTARNMPTDAGQIGTGVEVESINRLRDEFIDGQIRSQNQSSGRWNKIAEGLERIEYIFNEPSDSNLDQALTDFRDSLQELSNNPENSAVREEVRQRGQTLSDTFNDLHRRLRDYQESLNDDVGATVDEINSIFERIADLNREIVHAEASGQDANDHRDSRDLLLDELNELVDVSAREDDRGNLNISLDGTSVVSGTSFNELETVENGDRQDEVHFAHIDREANVRGGELRGIMDVRDDELEDNYIEDLNQMAETLANEFNAVHRTGFDGNQERAGDFFDIDTGPDDEAQALNLAGDIRESSENIAAGNYSDNPSVARLNPGWLDEDGLDDIEDEDYYYRLDVSQFSEEERVEFTFEELYFGDTRHEFEVELEYDEDNEIYEATIYDEEGNELADGITIEDLQDVSTENLFDPEQFDEIDEDEGLINDFRFGLHSRGEANISFDPSAGSGSNAGLLANIIDEEGFEDLDGSSVKDYFEGVISSLGVDGQRANRMVENNELMSEQLENQRQSISGVSLDEEMANMVKYQQGYAAAANVITTAQQNMDTLMGIMQ